MGNIINYFCPNCNASIQHEDGENEAQFEYCPQCGSQISLDRLRAAAASNIGASAPPPSYLGSSVGSDAAAVTYLDTAESALAYLENYFETYNWDDFAYTSALTIPAVDRILEKILIKAAANPAAWELQFTAISTPILKKINGLKKLEERFLAEYVKARDMADCFTYFDSYKRIVNRLVDDKEAIVKKLISAIKYCQKYGGAEALVKQLTAQATAIKKELDGLNTVREYKDLPGFAKAKQEKQTAFARMYGNQGIDADAVYNAALEAYEKGGDMRSALAGFGTVAGYKDASEYARKADGWVDVPVEEGEFLLLGNKHYLKKKIAAQSFLNVAGTTGAEESTAVAHWDLYEIVGGKPADEPVVTGITAELAHFGGGYVYCKDGREIRLFVSNSKADNMLLEVAPEKIAVLKDGGEPLIHNGKMFVQQQLDAVTIVEQEKKGCSLFGKKPEPKYTVNNNNYKLLAVDLVTARVDVAIPEYVDIQEIFGDEIFFNKVAQGDDFDLKETFHAYNYKTKRTQTLLSSDTEIRAVTDNKVVYLNWLPTTYNNDLCTYDLATGEKKVLAHNVYDYYGTIDGMIYYYVGNGRIRTLYRINTDGTEKKEIRSNAQLFGAADYVVNGWLYITIGKGLNRTLYKMSADGEKFVSLCQHLKRIVSIRDGYVYYVNSNNALCSVREDGGELKEIVRDVENFVELTDNGIFLLRTELVDDDVRRKSLYRVNLDGSELTKVAFDVTFARLNPSNDDEIYLSKTNIVTYSIKVPIDKTNYETHYETRDIRTVVLYNMASDSFRELAVFGKPKFDSSEFKSGCFGKKVTKDVIVTEIPTKKTFKRKGKMRAGEIADEQLEETAAEGGGSTMNASVTSSNYTANYSASATAAKPVRATGPLKKVTKPVNAIAGAIVGAVFMIVALIVSGSESVASMIIGQFGIYVGVIGAIANGVFLRREIVYKRELNILRIVSEIVLVLCFIVSIVALISGIN